MRCDAFPLEMIQPLFHLGKHEPLSLTKRNNFSVMNFRKLRHFKFVHILSFTHVARVRGLRCGNARSILASRRHYWHSASALPGVIVSVLCRQRVSADILFQHFSLASCWYFSIMSVHGLRICVSTSACHFVIILSALCRCLYPMYICLIKVYASDG